MISTQREATYGYDVYDLRELEGVMIYDPHFPNRRCGFIFIVGCDRLNRRMSDLHYTCIGEEGKCPHMLWVGNNGNVHTTACSTFIEAGRVFVELPQRFVVVR